MCPVWVLYESCMCPVCVLCVSYVSCMCPVWVLYVSCMSPVCVLYVSCMCPVWVLYVSCMSPVCVLYVSCVCPICVLYVLIIILIIIGAQWTRIVIWCWRPYRGKGLARGLCMSATEGGTLSTFRWVWYVSCCKQPLNYDKKLLILSWASGACEYGVYMYVMLAVLWSYFAMVLYDDIVWWYHMMILYDGIIGWCYMMVLYDGIIWWYCMMVLYDDITTPLQYLSPGHPPLGRIATHILSVSIPLICTPAQT